MTFHILSMIFLCYEMAPDRLKTVPNVVLASLISGYLHASFFSLHFTCLFHFQSFQKV